MDYTYVKEKRMNEQLDEFRHILTQQEHYSGELSFSEASKILYSTDASIYQIEPKGVAFPKNQDDLVAIIRAANLVQLPVTARGSGSSLAGQAIGSSLIIDCSRYLNRIIEVDLQNQQVVLEPGVILSSLNKKLSAHKLQFGPDPASADRATIGGCIANNATGAHSIVYGMTGDHLSEVDVILSDGNPALFQQMTIKKLDMLAAGNDLLSGIARVVKNIRENYSDEIKENWPVTWRRVSGYNINYIIPWSATIPPLWSESSKDWKISAEGDFPYPPINHNTLNFAHLLAGSEGTLGIINQAKLNLVPKPEYSILVVKAYSGIANACDEIPGLLELKPTAIELIPQSLIKLARSVPAYAHLLTFVSELSESGEDPAALLVMEFSGKVFAKLREIANKFNSSAYIAESAAAQQQVWAVRKVGLGILMSRQGDHKPVAFIEDMAVPVNNLSVFVREMERILSEHGTQVDFYAHASAGCLHIRPIINLKSASGVKNLRSIAEKAVALTLQLKGAISAEHGDGLARSEWITVAYGNKINEVFRELKNAADPSNLLNPGKIIDPPRMDTNLRYGETYATKVWQPVFTYGKPKDKKNIGIAEAVEQCNGAGVCRKTDGVMCPSFQASHDEMHSTRGRANLLRAMISGQIPEDYKSEKMVKNALDLCLACKGCKSECPSGVDIAKLKYEFLEYYYKQPRNNHPWRDFLFGYIHAFGKLGYPVRSIVNYIFKNRLFLEASDTFLGLSRKRPFPVYAPNSLENIWNKRAKYNHGFSEKVLFLSDAFTEYFHVESGFAALRILELTGSEVVILPVLGAGRTLISKGFLTAAKSYAWQLITAIKKLDPTGKYSVIGIEPSEIYTLKDEFMDFFPEDPYVHDLSQRSWMADEFLLRPELNGQPRVSKLTLSDTTSKIKVLLHSHCYQKAQPPAEDGFPTGTSATVKLLETFKFNVELIEAGCCGMAGAFGYESEHYAFSQKVGELSLFPTIREHQNNTEQFIVSVSGVSCHTQIEDGTSIKPIHPMQLVNNLFDDVSQTAGSTK